MADAEAKKIAKLYGSLKTQKHKGVQAEIDDVLRLVLNDHQATSSNVLDKDSPPQERPLSAMAGLAGRKLASNVASYTYTEGDQNFILRKSKASKLTDAFATWLQQASHTAQRYLQQSNHSQVYGELSLFLTNIGAACVSVDYDAEEGELFFQHHPVSGEVYFIEDAKGRVDGVLRCLDMLGHQCVEMFGESATKDMQQAFKDLDMNKRFKVLYIVARNPDYDAGKVGSFRYVDIYADEQGEKTLKKGTGFNTFPFFCPRWEKVKGGHPYGQGAGHTALPTIKGANTLEALFEDAVEHEAFPTGFVSDADAVSQAQYKPRTFNYADMSQGAPVFARVTSNAGPLAQRLAMMEARIEEMFYNDVFSSLATNPVSGRTEDEIHELTNEKISTIAPMINRLRSEYWAPMIKRVIVLLMQNGLIPEAPVDWDAGDVEISYTSRIDAQFDAILASREVQALQEAAAVMQMGEQVPGMNKVAKLRETAVAILKARNFDMDRILDDDEASQLEELEAQNREMAMQLEAHKAAFKPVDPAAPVSRDSVLGQQVQPSMR